MRGFRPVLIATAAALAGCSSAPSGDGRWLTQPTAAQHTALYFPIATGPHAVECNACHGGTSSFVEFDCLSCHLQAPTAASHAGVGGFSYDSPSCYGCHLDGTGNGAIDHTRKFPIAPGQVHAIGSPAVHQTGAIQCASCHTKASAWANVDCTVCHNPADQTAKHDGRVGLEPNGVAPLWRGTGALPTGGTANCLLCHAAGGLEKVASHAQDQAQPAGFPVASGNHFQSCEQCHTGRVTDPARKSAEIEFAAADCANCHSESQDQVRTRHTAFSVNLASPPATTATCLSCHPNGGTAANFQHASFPIGSGAVHALGAAAVHVTGAINCRSCHTPATNADYTKADCTICHTAISMQPLHAAVADLPASYASPDTATFATSGLCLRCHADSTVPASIATAHTPPAPAHTPFLVTSGTAHFRQDCLDCHVASRTDKPWAADFAKPQHCTGCHVEPTTSANHLGTSWAGYPGTYGYSDSACLNCHSAGAIGPFDHSADFPTAAGDVHRSGVAPCLSCHTSSTNPGDITTIGCVGCHNNSASSVDAPGGVNSKHTTPAAGATLIGFGYSFDSSTPAATVTTNGLCLKCHAGTIATPTWKNTLVMPLTQHNSLCFSQGVTSGRHRVNQTNAGTPLCFFCHAAMNPAPKPWGVDWSLATCNGSGCHSNQNPTRCR